MKRKEVTDKDETDNRYNSHSNRGLEISYRASKARGEKTKKKKTTNIGKKLK